MQCFYCDETASVPVEKDGVKVWLCDRHIKQKFEELANVESTEELESILTE